MFKYSGPKRRLTGRRVAFVIEKLADRSGGAERVLIEAANEMAMRGHAVEIITHEYRGRPPFYDIEVGVHLTNLRRHDRTRLNKVGYKFRSLVERFHPIPVVSRLSWMSKHGAFWRRLERHLQHNVPDAVVAFMPPAISALALAKLDPKVRKIASTHNAPIQDFTNPERWDPSRLDRRRRLRLLKKIDLITVLLPEYQSWHAQEISEKIKVLPNAVSEVPQSVLNAAEREHIVVSVGRLASVKRHETLLRAWQIISKEHPSWKLRIYGDGPLKGYLLSLIQELGLTSAELCGHTPQIGAVYLRGKILAHPSQFEGFPLAVTEALASGMPVVGFSDCSGLNTLVEDGVNGILVPETEDRVSSFASALSNLMAQESKISALSKNGPSSMKQYSPDDVYTTWENILFSGATQSLGLRAS